jgi:dTDP-4-amino-4,6-dideoxygalactose transaminase
MATCNVSFTIRYKYNMTDIQAAIGLKQLPKLDRFNAIRDKLCQLYQEGLADLPEITLPPPPSPYVRHARHLFVIALNPGRLSIDRDRFVEALTAENIGVGFHFVALHLHPYYRRRLPYRPGDLPVAEDLSRQVVSLPLSPAHTEQDIADVITAVRRIVTYFRKR